MAEREGVDEGKDEAETSKGKEGEHFPDLGVVNCICSGNNIPAPQIKKNRQEEEVCLEFYRSIKG